MHCGDKESQLAAILFLFNAYLTVVLRPWCPSLSFQPMYTASLGLLQTSRLEIAGELRLVSHPAEASALFLGCKCISATDKRDPDTFRVA